MKRPVSAFAVLPVLSLLAVRCATPVNNPIEGKVLFKIQETYAAENTEPVLTLLMQTEKVYECCNYRINDTVSVAGGKVHVDLQGVVVPDICLTALGSAFSSEPLVLADGSYALRFTKSLFTSNCSLTVTPEKIEIGAAAFDFVVPQATVFWRYPQNSFAYLCGTTADTAWIYDDFLAQIRAAVPLEEITFPDYGETGYPRATQGYWNNGPARYFVYGGESDFDSAGELLRIYAQQVLSQHSGVGIWLLNWKNRAFRSWQMSGS
jgi:hypothetical protein